MTKMSTEEIRIDHNELSKLDIDSQIEIMSLYVNHLSSLNPNGNQLLREEIAFLERLVRGDGNEA